MCKYKQLILSLQIKQQKILNHKNLVRSKICITFVGQNQNMNMKKKLLTLALALFGMAITMVAQSEVHYLKGKLNGKIAFELMYEVKAVSSNDIRTAGYMYYPKAKNPAPILIAGNREQLEEYQPDGEITGKLDLSYNKVDGGYQFKSGTWTNPNTGRKLPLTNVEELNDQNPSWYPGKPKTLSAPKREDYSFKYHFTDEDEYTKNIVVEMYANGEKLEETKILVSGPVSEEMEKELTWIEETDINFDGIPDLMIYTGITTHAQSMHNAYVWNPTTLQFYYSEGFESLVEPDFDTENKEIRTVVREGYEHAYFEVYKWKNGKLKQISSKREKLFDDEE